MNHASIKNRNTRAATRKEREKKNRLGRKGKKRKKERNEIMLYVNSVMYLSILNL